MSELESLRLQAKLSMESMIERAHLQDRIGHNKHLRIINARGIVSALVFVPFVVLGSYAIYQHSLLHRGYTASFDNMMLRGGTSTREVYAPDIYRKDKASRPNKIS